ncbi:MAG: 4Fe-4S binding protein [Deltaproteobacteria bacterium]|nr:4Fe-4S binding protein [Deltaproteobacteria bacterium]
MLRSTLTAPAGKGDSRTIPIVEHGRCEGKGDCVAVRPYHVFEVRTIDSADYDRLSFLQRIKSRVHGQRTAYAPRAADCQACGLCVAACPESAIRLDPVR